MSEFRKIKIAGLNLAPGAPEKELIAEAAARLCLAYGDIAGAKVLKRSLDARGRRAPRYEYTLGVLLPENIEIPAINNVSPWREFERVPIPPRGAAELRAVVVGAGPAGLFAALRLTEYGVRVRVLEQGKPLHERTKDVAEYWRRANLTPSSNVQFGEGGAGAYSDGKLTTRVKDYRKGWVLSNIAAAGGGESVLVDSKPHLGTGRLRTVVKRLRERLLSRGVEFYYNTYVDDLYMVNGEVRGVTTAAGPVEADAVFLAVGHSSRGLAVNLVRAGVLLEAKGFAMGVRLELPQSAVNLAQYGDYCQMPALPPAEFVLKERGIEGRGVYSFCMCPGGTIVPAGTEANGVVVNGMSGTNRSGRFANSAIVVEVRPEDFGMDPLGGINFQRRWERAAFESAGRGYLPAQRVSTFLGAGDERVKERCSAPWPLVERQLASLLPEFVRESLKSALPKMEGKISAVREGTLVGVETRTSSPFRITRTEEMCSLSHPRLYPVGEGAGYAGGIVSAAVDGARAVDEWCRLMGGGLQERELDIEVKS
ncbi:MAG: hypothetical protein C0608_02310 [Deltaproteobacteria bacterium]|nr:MAG: hypothetical protein C0608_02310 [Deltaproteobacteria bacterium]